jgi:oligopeptide transport system substrate-binding protein
MNVTSNNRTLTAFTNLLDCSVAKGNRRDFLRVSSIAAAAAAMPPGKIAAKQSTPSSSPAPGEPFTLTLPFNAFGQPLITDPHRAANWGPFWVMLPYAWSGLLRFDENGAVEADLAESVEPNEDGTTYTAVLREGVAFADGTPITAQHVIASWHRALDSTTLSPMSRFMEPITSATEIASGENVPLGAVAMDDRTIEISLTAPLAHFPSYLATFGFAVVHPDIDNQDQPLAPGDACSGPWKITDSSDFEIVMVPNPHHWSEPSADVTELVWQVAPGGNTDQAIIDWYRNDEIAVADAPIGLLKSVRTDEALAAELRSFETWASTMVLSLDFHQAPFNDVRVRHAVAATIDRETWCNDIQQGTYVPATRFTPPALEMIANYTYAGDPVAAGATPAALLQEAGINTAESEEQIIFFQPATDSVDAMERIAALLQMITDGTGLQITHDTALTAEQITAARQDAGGLQLAMLQWQLDSNQPSILEAYAPDSEYNNGWVNWEPNLEDSGDFTPGADAATYGELIASAVTTLDETERNATYAEAEALLLKNAVVIPLGHWNPQYLQKPWLVGTRQGPWSGSTPVRIDSDVTINRELIPATPDSTPEA